MVLARTRTLIREPFPRMRLRGRLMHPVYRRRFAAFGDDTILDRPVWLAGTHKIAIGANGLIFRGCMLSVPREGQDRAGTVLQIGDNVVLTRMVTLSAAESLIIEDYVCIGSYTTVLDNDHLHIGPHDNVFYNPSVTAPVRIGYGTWIAERCAVLRGSTIGRYCTIGANSVVRGDIPDYSIAVGAPARVIGSNREALKRQGKI